MFCGSGGRVKLSGLVNDIGRKDFLPMVYNVIRELREVFVTSSYFHFGSDERILTTSCFNESGFQEEDPPYSSFERNLAQMSQEYLGMSPQHILRWENEEQKRYPDRFGDITHYRSVHPFSLPNVRDGERFFVTIDLLLSPTPSSRQGHTLLSLLFGLYQNTRQLVKLRPMGVFAEIRQLDQNTFQVYNGGLRLISFLLATQEKDQDFDIDIFKEKLQEKCRLSHFQNCEVDMSFPSNTTDIEYTVETIKFRNKLCERFTNLHEVRVPKKTIV